MTVLRLRTDGVEWHGVDGGVVALDTTAGQYLALNDTGALVWRRLANGATRAELVAAVLAAYDVAPAAAAADVDALLAKLDRHRLLRSDAAAV